MSDVPRKPVIVIICAQFHQPYHYRLLKGSLEKHGYVVSVVQLASTSETRVDNAMSKDIAVIQHAVARETDVGHDVVVVLHSAAGAPGSAALQGRGKLGWAPGVVRIVFLAALLVPPGMSIYDQLRGLEPSWVHVKDGLLYPASPHFVWYGDVPGDVADDAVAHLLPWNHEAIMTPIQTDRMAWTDVPSSYVIFGQDNALTPAVAQWMVAVNQVPCEMLEIPNCGHGASLSMPERVASIIRQAAGEKNRLEGVEVGKNVAREMEMRPDLFFGA